ncbi:cell division protein ZipA [Microbulbifer sp. 2205BS26-8]|uniref:cell division protein ZipA n=1 Tax=Microbulbifer sp. 2205BS26-8 TaxID=3064386 RepID=UPI00273E90B4|nr:cell division protein ZipA [Microbulbifer sp. 2205BS26-8]MDP5210300.1 cell division protein ZipA [Microbulbifer sp. 2205BS26-8]
MNNWLVTILIVVVLVAVLDGVRRAIVRQRAAVKVSRKLSRAMQFEVDGDADPVSGTRLSTEGGDDVSAGTYDKVKPRQVTSELPGQVRVVQRRALEDALHVNRQVQESFISSRRPLAGSTPPRNLQEQGMLDFEEQVPTLMESIVDGQRFEPELNEFESLEVLGTESHPSAPPEEDNPRQEVLDDQYSQTLSRDTGQSQEKSPVRDEVLVINVMAPEGDCFEGNDLLRVMLAAGMRFGEMNIFHYHEGGGADGSVIFSLANIVVPGVFDLTQMEEFTTPGVSLFLALPVEGEAIKAFDQLLSTAYKIAELLGGELKDENRSVFTAQTAGHYRQRVVEYQRCRALALAQS